MAGVGNYLMGAIAVVASALVAVFFGGVLFAIVRWDSFIEVAALAVVMVLFALLVFFLFLRNGPERNDFLLVGMGGTIGLVAYPLTYLVIDKDIEIAEYAVAAILIVLAVVTILYTYRMVKRSGTSY